MPQGTQDRIQRAREGFAGPLNCAQAVAAAFQDLTGCAPEHISDHSKNGGGRAPGGICGALHAGLEVLREDAQREAVTVQFAEIVGSTLCREIRKAKQVTCADCVETAAILLNKTLSEGGTGLSPSGQSVTGDEPSGH
jgi:hypothetical protein